MKAVVQNKFGDVDTFSLQTVDLPTLGDHDILVKIHSQAVNPVDTYKRKGVFGNAPLDVLKYQIIGFDGAGTVEKLGAKASLFKVGDKVYFSGLFTLNGTNSEYTAVDERIVGRMPSNLDWKNASTAPLCCLTAWEGIFESLTISTDPKVNAGKSILIIGGSGGVGGYAIQIAKHAGLTVIATASRKETVEFCKKFGSDYVIDHKGNLLDQIKEIKELNGGVNYVYNTSSTEQYFSVISTLLHPLGKAVFINGTTEKLEVGLYMFKRLTFAYELMFTRPLFNSEPEKQGHILNEVSTLFEKGIIKSTLEHSFPMTVENLTKAHKMIESRTTIGKISLYWE